jgi:hypothetical protein
VLVRDFLFVHGKEACGGAESNRGSGRMIQSITEGGVAGAHCSFEAIDDMIPLLLADHSSSEVSA